MARSVPVIIEAKVPAMIIAATGDDPAGADQGDPEPLDRPEPLLLLDDPGDQVDVVVLAHGDEDHEEEHRHFPVQAVERSP